MQVWAISQEPPQAMEAFRDALGLTLPLLHDAGGAAFRQYAQEMAFPTGAYPQEIIVGPDGTIIYANNRFEHEAVVTVIEEALSR